MGLRRRVALLLVPLILFSLVTAFAQIDPTAEFDPHRVIIKFKPRSRLLTLSSSPQAGGRLAQVRSLTALKLDAEPRLQALAGGVERIFVAELTEGANLEEVLRNLAADPDVEYAEPDYIGHGDGPGRPSAAGLNYAALEPGDPDLNWQWGISNTGQFPFYGTPGIDVNALHAWDITTGDSKTILAVLDTGIALGHPDFAGRIIQGKNFVNTSKNPVDDYGHGTNVASVAAATGGNGIGIAGMNWKCRILPIKILDSNNSGLYSWFASGFIYAADNGASVINISAGGSGQSQALADAVTYAQSRGVIIVACMMNSNNETPYYPAAYPGVIAIGAIDMHGARVVPFCYSSTTGSNYGSHIAFVAPGNEILGLDYLNFSSSNYWCGTSQATPFVSGLVTLMLAVNPSLTYQQVYDALKAGARDQIGPAKEDAPGWDKYFGWGLIDSYKSLLAVASGSNTFAQVAIGGGYSTTFTFLNTGSDTSSGNLILTGEDGKAMSASFASPGSSGTVTSSFPISVPPGGMQTVTASPVNADDATRAGWARIISSGGALGGVATFRLVHGDMLATVVGVLASDATGTATIPVDDDRSQSAQGRVTAYAVANPGTEDINIDLILVNPDGSIARTLQPPALNPLSAGCHVARFLWEDLEDPNLKFTGSMVLVARASKTFSAVALVFDQGLYTAIPVVPGKAANVAAGGSTSISNMFAQVAIGGGYTTVYTLLNTGSDTTSGNLILTDDSAKPMNAAFASQGYAALVASSFPVSVAPGGMQSITAGAINPGDAAKAGWARVESSGGSPAGVATFRLMNAGVLATIVGVLSADATNAATIPVDDDRTLGAKSRMTAYAVANPGTEDINIKVVLVNPDGSVARSIEPPGLNPLKPGCHRAGFLWEDLNDPNLQFRGSAVLLAQSAKTFSVVALVLDQGLYTSIPVIPAKAPGIQ
jgi:thermitase